MNPIEINGLSKTYKGKRGSRVEALQELTMAVPAGDVFGFLGPNGAGKSTTIKILMGLIAPTRGVATLCGRPVTDHSSRRNVGYLPENPSVYDFMTAREYLAFSGRIFGMGAEKVKRESGRVLELLSLSTAADRPIRGFSKGMVQRLCLAQTLLHDPEVFILDEPMSGLDPIGRALVKEIMKDLKARGKTVFFSTHITADVEAVCDRVAVIAAGRLQTLNSVEELLASGIEGYIVKVSGGDASLCEGLDALERGDGTMEISVPTPLLQDFLKKLTHSGGRIVLIEPKRKDLETFFLDIVSR